MIKSPGRSNGYLALVKTLDAGTWLLTFVILLFGSALASLPYYVHRCRDQKSAKSEVEPGFMGLAECLYQSFALLCQQGETKYGVHSMVLVRTECNNNICYTWNAGLLPEGITSCSVLITWASILTCIVVVFAAYDAELTTKLSVFITHLPFESLRELYSETDYNIGAVVDTATEEAFSQVLLYLSIFDSKSIERAMRKRCCIVFQSAVSYVHVL